MIELYCISKIYNNIVILRPNNDTKFCYNIIMIYKDKNKSRFIINEVIYLLFVLNNHYEILNINMNIIFNKYK